MRTAKELHSVARALERSDRREHDHLEYCEIDWFCWLSRKKLPEPIC